MRPPEYFFKTTVGTSRPPDKEEAGQFVALREAGTLRRIKRFAHALIDGVPVRERTDQLATWSFWIGCGHAVVPACTSRARRSTRRAD